MSRQYQVGPFWLNEEPNSGKYFIYWYDEQRRRTKRKTTGTTSFQSAVDAITAHHLAHLEPEKEGGLTVHQVAMKYWLEHGKNIEASGHSSISLGRLTAFADYLEGKDGAPFLAENWTKQTTKAFITWVRKNPYHRTKEIKDGQGKVIEVIKTPMPVSDATINRNINDVRAAFRFAMDRPPLIEGIKGVQARGGRQKPTLSTKQVKALFAYAFETQERRHLQTYLIAAFTTLGRPDAVLDISVSPEREQVEWDYRRLHLNPSGREQNKKYRPIVPINDYLLPYLQEAEDRLEESKINPDIKTAGFLTEWNGKRMASPRASWNKAKEALGWPMVRDWDAKMIRHTMAKWLRAQGVPWAELEGHLGHKIPSTSETYAEYAPDYLGRVQQEITRFLDGIFEGQEWACTPIAPRFEKRVVSIISKKPANSGG
ncbi:MAG: tyrosine-type recombinase/integrase [Kordiimonadaceae bacterium]|nr:tyrosine-type recombinase/integrase [Kordiimonadaceae bacterium]